MKKLVTIVFAATLLAGCRSSYDVTLTNGLSFTGVSKPKLIQDRNVYVFKNASGRSYAIPETRVRTIEPHVNTEKSKFANRSDSPEFNSSGR